MSGLVVFTSLRAALNAGYHIYGRSERGYLARLRTEAGWALALVECGAVDDAERPGQPGERKEEASG